MNTPESICEIIWSNPGLCFGFWQQQKLQTRMYSYIGLYNFNVKRSFIDNRGGAAVCASSEPSCGSTITGIGSRASTSKEATHTQKSTKRRTTKENRGRIVATHRVCQHEYKASLKASGNWRSILGEWTPQAERKLKLGFHLCVTRMRMRQFLFEHIELIWEASIRPNVNANCNDKTNCCM